MTLDPSLARAIILATSFRGDSMHRCQAGLLMIGLRKQSFDAGELPGELCTNDAGQNDQRLAGMACASLAAQGLIECVGRVKSSNPLANGRKINQWRIPNEKTKTVQVWLSRHGYQDPETAQMELTA